MRERLKDFKGADAAYSAGLDLGGPTLPMFLARRADVRSRQRRWSAAIADCMAHPDVVPPRRLLPRLSQHLTTNGQIEKAVRMLLSAIDHKATGELLLALAECYESMGDFDSALPAMQHAVQLAPEDLNIRTNLGTMQARRSLIPFNPSIRPPTPVATEVAKDALTSAIEELENVIQTRHSRTWAAYWLGRVLESHGLLDDALSAYDIAVSRVEQVDKPWAYNAAQAWRFRSSYMKHRISEQTSDDFRLNRTVSLGPPSDHLFIAAGFFEAIVTNAGLLIEGSVLQEYDEGIEICADGRQIMITAGDSRLQFRSFKSTLVHDVLREFPRHWTLTLRVGAASLVTVGGADSATVTVPDGTDRLDTCLQAGYSINKKGRWSSGPEAAPPPEVQLRAYDKARRFFADELGIRLFVSYGTLLGCYRDGRPIPADDDFDVSFVTDATNPEDLKAEVRGVIMALLRGGFDSRVAVDGRMFHLRVDDVVLDMNPFWFFDGRAWAFDAHLLSRDVFVPVRSINIAGCKVDIPSKPEAFLEENYGPDWRTPRSDFQYHRAKSDRAVLRRTFLVPSEVRELHEYSEAIRSDISTPGTFQGYGDPANPGFR